MTVHSELLITAETFELECTICMNSLFLKEFSKLLIAQQFTKEHKGNLPLEIIFAF